MDENAPDDLAWSGRYAAFGDVVDQDGSDPERFRANTKEQDPTGLINDGFRYRDPQTGSFLTRDPAGFVDGPNLYTYVNQNPWSAFDPQGLEISNPWIRRSKEIQNNSKRSFPQSMAGAVLGIAGTVRALPEIVTTGFAGARDGLDQGAERLVEQGARGQIHPMVERGALLAIDATRMVVDQTAVVHGEPLARAITAPTGPTSPMRQRVSLLCEVAKRHLGQRPHVGLKAQASERQEDQDPEATPIIGTMSKWQAENMLIP